MEPVTLMVHVTDVEAGLEWYRKAFPSSRVSRPAKDGLAILEVNGFDLEIVAADARVSNGKEGSVLYWSVANVERALERLTDLGATLHRGPMLIENGQAMCQVEDPFGNLIGLRGGGGRVDDARVVPCQLGRDGVHVIALLESRVLQPGQPDTTPTHGDQHCKGGSRVLHHRAIELRGQLADSSCRYRPGTSFRASPSRTPARRPRVPGHRR